VNNTEIWIDGVKVPFWSAYVCFNSSDNIREQVQVTLNHHDENRRVRVVSGGDIVTECPVTYERWKRIAREG
jgi:hypothetical protein